LSNTTCSLPASKEEKGRRGGIIEGKRNEGKEYIKEDKEYIKEKAIFGDSST